MEVNVAMDNSFRLIASGILSTLLASASICAQEQQASASQTDIAAPTLTSEVTFTQLAPPKAPKVSCEGDRLTISADNSTLESVLNAVHACTGIQVDLPEGAPTGSRVFEELGPGPARQVLESLLNGSEFNFVIGSSEANPQKIDSVLLLLKPADTELPSPGAERALTPARRAWLASRQSGRPKAVTGDESTLSVEDSSEAAASLPADDSKPAAGVPPAGEAPHPAADAQPSPADSSAIAPIITAPVASSDAPVVAPDKSTEERISDMQQMFQQRRQLNQNQNQNPNPAPPQQ
jgi:hypothetical protein